MASTPGSTLTYAEKVEADKRSILSKALKADLLKVSRVITQFESMTNKKYSKESVSDDDYDSVFGEDEDDSDEVFNKVLAEARAQFLREKELKRKNPFHLKPNDLFKKPPKKRERKRKNKAIEDSIKVMNDFKRNLLEAKEPTLPVPPVHTVSTEKTRLSSEISAPVRGTQKLEPRMKIYPSWKTTATYTPIFSMPSNPRWTNIKTIPDLSNMQTPKKSHKETFTVNVSSKNHPSMVHTPYRSIRSDATTCHTEVCSRSPLISPRSPDNSGTPAQKGTVVRFKPSPHEQIPCSSDDWSSSSSGSLYGESLQQDQNYIKTVEIYQGTHKDQDDCKNPSLMMSPSSFNNSFEFQHEYLINQRNQMSDFQGDYGNNHIHDHFDTSIDANETTSNVFGDHPIYMNDFSRALKSNVVDRNFHMKVKYSMKVQCFN